MTDYFVLSDFFGMIGTDFRGKSETLGVLSTSDYQNARSRSTDARPLAR